MSAAGAGAQESLGGGMTAPQLFSSNCSACHRSPQGLAKGRSAQALAGFLRRHYTTGPNPAATLAAYLAAAGDAPPGRATASRPAAPPQQQRQPATQQQRQAAVPPAQQAPSQRQPSPAGPPPASAAPAARSVPAETQAPQRRQRLQGEVASVSSDPDPVVVSRQPVPLAHQRATSQAQDARQQAREKADEEARQQRAAQAAAAPAEVPAAAPAPAAAVPPDDGAAAGTEPMAATEAADDKASQAFSAPLP